MFRFVFLLLVFACSTASAGDVLYYACVGEDQEYQVAALQQVIESNNGVVSSTFALDLASATDEDMTRYHQKGDLVFSSEPAYEEDEIVVGTFEKDGKEVGISIFYYWKTGYRIELSTGQRIVKMPCNKKV